MEPTQFQAARERLNQVQTYLDDGTLIEGEDYGIAGGFKKPSLFKPGAQKLMALFDLASVIKDVQTDRGGDWVNHKVVVAIIDKQTGMTVSEGVGSCDSREAKYKRQDVFGIDNTILKMAKKRGQIDAVLDATGSASLLTQDGDEVSVEHNEPQRQAPRPQASHSPNSGPSQFIVPFGNDKGTPFDQLDLRNLKWWEERSVNDLNPNSQYYKEQYVAATQKRLDHIRELISRMEGPTDPMEAAARDTHGEPPPQTQPRPVLQIATEAELKRANEIRDYAISMGYVTERGTPPKPLGANTEFRTMELFKARWLAFIEQKEQADQIPATELVEAAA